MIKQLAGIACATLLAIGALAQPAAAQDYYGYTYTGGVPAGYGYGYAPSWNYGHAGYYDGYSHAAYAPGAYTGYVNKGYYGTYENPYGYQSYGRYGYGAYGYAGYGYAGPNYVRHRNSQITLTAPTDFHIEPSVAAPMYGVLEPGVHLTILGRGNGWAKVRSRYGTVGYIPDGQAVWY